MALTTKRRAFIEFYLRCWNGTQAADLAGFKHPRQQASRLLSDVNIQAAIQARLDELQMSADEVLTRLSEMARADISDFVNDFGGIDWDRVRARGYLVKKVRHNKGKNSEIELHDAKDALVWIGKHHKLFVERKEITGEDGGPIETVTNVRLGELTDAELDTLAEIARRLRGD